MPGISPLLLSAIANTALQAGKFGWTLFNKPKKSMFRNEEMENTLQRIIANNQADIVNKTLMNQITSQAKSLGARIYQQQQHGLEIGREQGLLSPGQYAQGLITAGAETQANVGAQAQQAELAQAQDWQNKNAQNNQLMLQLAQAKDEAKRNYEMAKQQWGTETMGAGMDVLSAGTNALSQYFTQQTQNDAIKAIMTKFGEPTQWDTNTMLNAMFMLQLYEMNPKLMKDILNP